MIRSLLTTLVVLVVAIGGGAASVWYTLQSQEGIGAVTIGGWTAFPAIGTPDADPYSKARVAREGMLALGHAEGLVFYAHHDSRGDALRRDCDYKIEGQTPPARFWTMFAADEGHEVLPLSGRAAPAIQSQEVLRLADNTFSIGFGPRPVPGNWVRVEGDGRFSLVLTLYDTPLASNPGFADMALPQVLRTGCDG